ncbi:MAG: tetratricopeptide repeat-containing glycosyltransferase, partial [Paraclostridium sp.]
IKNAIDEIIIVDTGSSDDTVNIAKELGCIVYNYEWIDNFGDARNFAFSNATKDYIMWLDADDIVTEENLNKIINIKKNFNTQIDSINMRYVLSEDTNGNEGFVLKRNRIVKRSNGFKWIGFIHEYLEVYGNIYYSDISIHHKKDKEYTDRNLRIYNKMIEKGIELSVRDMLYYANELYYNLKFSQAIEAYHKFLDTNQGWVEDVKTALFNLSKSYAIKGNHEKQLETLLQSFKYDIPRADFCCEIGEYFFNRKDYNKAIFWYKEASKCDNKESIAILDHATYTWIPYLQLCVCYSHLEDYESANYYNEKAGTYIPNDARIHQNRAYLKDKINV